MPKIQIFKIIHFKKKITKPIQWNFVDFISISEIAKVRQWPIEAAERDVK